ncbi:MAG: hypothetical protein Q8K63_04565 [Acidimicrobiales bacterium]|nr:hypothetical protein [Acidimicrobiales bacterium]
MTLAHTSAFTPRTGSAIDPLVEEVTWQAWELAAADPGRLSEASLQSCTIGFDCLVESAWRPGRSAVITEVAWNPARVADPLDVRLALGVLGPRDTTARDAAGLRPRAESATAANRLFASREIDPSVLLPGLGGEAVELGEHAAHVLQALWSFGDDEDLVQVVSRFSPTIEPWFAVVDHLRRADEAIRVRATVLATELSPSDRIELDSGLARCQAIRDRNPDRRDVAFDADRAEATLLDLRASLASPSLVSEIAICSERELPDTFLRSVASCFTSETDVLRQQGRVVVASNRLLLGGFEIVRNPPLWKEGQSLGVPVSGGLASRELRHLLTLTESPVGWPAPWHGALPSKPTHVPRPVLDTPRVLPDDDAVPMGVADAGRVVTLPSALRTRHMLVTGSWGAGKTTLLFAQVLADLRGDRPFVFVDPHGTAADGLIAFAHALGRDPLVIDAADGATARLRPLPQMKGARKNRTSVEREIRRVSDAVASSLPNAEWAGPLWFANFEALLEVVAVHGGELIDAATWLNDPIQLKERIAHPTVSDLTRSTLTNLLVSTGNSADVRSWVSSKLHPLVSGDVRRIVHRAGKGVDVAQVVADGRPVIVSLAALSTSEANLVGHLVLSCVFEMALTRPVGERSLITCYVDEAHRFPTRGLSRMMTEGRKFEIALALSTQSLGQLTGDLADLALACGSLVAFRATPDTATRLAPMLGVPAYELTGLADLQAVVRLQGGTPTSISVPPYEVCETPRVVLPMRPRTRRSARGDKPNDESRPERPKQPLVVAPARDDSLIDSFLARLKSTGTDAS